VSFRATLIILNGIALTVLVVFVVYRVVSLRRNPEVREPVNVAPGLTDEDLEGRKLDRVLGWSLLFVLVIAVALPLYFLVEPGRQANLSDQFRERSIERGAVLFANSSSEEYDSTKSLLCADCHGVDGTGGSATFTLQPEDDECLKEENQGRVDKPNCLPQQVTWTAPDLTLAALRYDRAQLNQVITYGRQGTPMPAWGVKSGRGSKNEQSIQDLVNYLESIQADPDEAKPAAQASVAKYRKGARDLVLAVDGDGNRTGLQVDLEAAEEELDKLRADPDTPADAIAEGEEVVADAEAALEKGIEYRDEVQRLSDGAVLFRLNCARCHTKGWSYFENEPARVDLRGVAEQGSGAFGPPLIGDSVELQFPGEAGEQEQFDWVAIGVPANDLYGQRGISSGRMPHFGQVLTDDQITKIVQYERSL
jgi:mono/diheme cytochrome c family protein